MGYGMCGFRRTPAAFKARQPNAAGTNRPVLQVESPTVRANRTVKTITAQCAGQNQRNWDEKWPEIMLAVNTSVSESTGYTPSFREPRLPSALYDRETVRTQPQKYPDCVIKGNTLYRNIPQRAARMSQHGRCASRNLYRKRC